MAIPVEPERRRVCEILDEFPTTIKMRRLKAELEEEFKLRPFRVKITAEHSNVDWTTFLANPDRVICVLDHDDGRYFTLVADTLLCGHR